MGQKSPSTGRCYSVSMTWGVVMPVGLMNFPARKDNKNSRGTQYSAMAVD
jgi:hypothetical protein